MRTWRCALVPVFVPHALARRASRPGPALPRRTRLQVLVVALMVVDLVLVLVLVLVVLVLVLVLVLLMLASRLMATTMMRQPSFTPSRTPPVVQGQPW